MYVAKHADNTPLYDNRYRKKIVSRDEVNQSACLLVMSLGEAERRGVDPNKYIFLVGSGEV